MNELGMNFERIEEKYVENISELLIEKYNLNEKDAETTKNILNGCDGITITTWVIRF